MILNTTSGRKNIIKNCTTCPERSALFNLLTTDELGLIEKNRFEVTFRAGEIIRKQGTFLSHVISLSAGLAKLYLEGVDYHKIILRIIKPVGFIGGPGMYLDNRHHFSVAALEDSCACFIDANVLKEIVHSNKLFGNGFISELSNNTLVTYHRLLNLTQKHMAGRIADTLLYLSDEVYGSLTFRLKLSNNDMAELSGMSKDNVVRNLKTFHDDGIIKMEDRTIEILDLNTLKNISRVG